MTKRRIPLPRRHNKGETNPNARLNWERVRMMRQMGKDGFSRKLIAEICHVTESTVSSVLLEKTWKIKKAP